jgi:hypothetical protein
MTSGLRQARPVMQNFHPDAVGPSGGGAMVTTIPLNAAKADRE